MSEAELHMAIAAHRAGRLSVAERHYRAFLEAQPDHGGARHNVGLLIIQRGAPAEALAHLALACQSEPGRGQNWFSYARATLSQGRVEEALPLLEMAQARGTSGPAFEAALQQTRTAHSKEGLSATVARCESAAAYEPSKPERHFELANAQAALGQIERAVASYQRAVELDTCFAEAQFRLASLLSENGRIAQGFHHYLRRAQLVHGQGSAPPSAASEPAHKIKHDR